MIKRQHYALLHRGDDGSSSSSSDDDSEIEIEKVNDATSPGSADDGGSEVTSEVEAHSSDAEEEKPEIEQSRKDLDKNQWAEAVDEAEKEKLEDEAENSAVIQISENVTKCRLCPKIVCLSEAAMISHLNSKRHARSVKKYSEGKLRVTLNSEGEEEEETETHADRLARMATLVESVKSVKPCKRRRDSGRQRQRKRAKRQPKNKKA